MQRINLICTTFLFTTFVSVDLSFVYLVADAFPQFVEVVVWKRTEICNRKPGKRILFDLTTERAELEVPFRFTRYQ